MLNQNQSQNQNQNPNQSNNGNKGHRNGFTPPQQQNMAFQVQQHVAQQFGNQQRGGNNGKNANFPAMQHNQSQNQNPNPVPMQQHVPPNAIAVTSVEAST